MTVTNISPPFTYSYQCSSTLVISYIPVYIYMSCIQIVGVLLRTLIFFTVDYSSFPGWMQSHLPGICWPLYWKSDSYRKPSDLLKSDKILSPITNNLMILLTFGLCSPILAFVIVCAIYLNGQQWLYFIGRFFLIRLKNPSKLMSSVSMSQESGQSVEISIDSTTSLDDTFNVETHKEFQFQRRRSDRGSMVSLVTDESLFIVDAILQRVSGYYNVCIWPIMTASCLFITCLSWDMAGDRVGWSGAIWVPICGGVMTPLLWIGNRCEQYYSKSRPPVELLGEEVENQMGLVNVL
jgi:hypothetical protein